VAFHWPLRGGLVNLSWIGKVPVRADRMIDVSMHLCLESSFYTFNYQSSPLPLRGIPLFKGGLSFQAAFGRQIVNLP